MIFFSFAVADVAKWQDKTGDHYEKIILFSALGQASKVCSFSRQDEIT